VKGIMLLLIPALNLRLSLILYPLLSGFLLSITDCALGDSEQSQTDNTSPFARGPVHEARTDA